VREFPHVHLRGNIEGGRRLRGRAELVAVVGSPGRVFEQSGL
jgi:hypothetical protein